MTAPTARVVVVPLTRIDVTPAEKGWGVIVNRAGRVRVMWRPTEDRARRLADVLLHPKRRQQRRHHRPHRRRNSARH